MIKRLGGLILLGVLVYFGHEQGWYGIETATRQICAITLPGETALDADRRIARALKVNLTPKVEREITRRYGLTIYKESRPLDCVEGRYLRFRLGPEGKKGR